MDEIPFEKVSVEDARRALHGDAVRSSGPLTPPKDWTQKRLPAAAQSNTELAPATFKWLAGLPREARPNALAHQYPRIVNRIAEIWKRPIQCERYIDDLMIDLRGDRQGFPPPVAAEIAALKAYFLRTANTVHFGVWGNRIGLD